MDQAKTAWIGHWYYRVLFSTCLQSDTFAIFDDDAGNVLSHEMTPLVDVDNRDGAGSGRRTAASHSSVVENFWRSV